MRQVKCTLPEGGTIEVTTPSFRRVFTGGDVVDLDRVIEPAKPHSKKDANDARPAVTLAVALGHHVEDHFAPLEAEREAPVAPADEE